MQIKFTASEQALFDVVAQEATKMGIPAFAVGGFVRDKILDRPTKDIDIVCLGDGLELATAFANQFKPRPPVSLFKTFGTAQVKLDSIEIEFVGARKESYSKDSRKPQVSPGSIEDDQNRRDFTINALAVELSENNFGTLIDPFGGVKDLENKILRTPLAPEQTFDDDPLRMMRAIRFATQLDFTITPETFIAIQKMADRIKIVSQERITDELQKIMMTDKPSKGWYLLKEAGLLQYIFPVLLQLEGAETLDGIGHKDNFSHTLQVLDNLAATSDDLWLRWAALLHDIAKPKTKKFETGFGWTFHGHEVVGARMVPKIFTQLKLPLNEKMKMVQKLVALHLRPISLTKETVTDSAIRRLLFDAGEDIDFLMLLCAADITSKNKVKVKRYLQGFDYVKLRLQEVEEKDNIRNWQPPITGEIIMELFAITPSKQVGMIKDAIREAILDGIIPNEYDAAYAFMLKEAEKLGLYPIIK
ncbi:MAG: HD domain-containing protein [Bacteroidetes bacterium]|jgi:putative nucleotidyltransferase with HDIG domain|nr:HD domain-containing protein [Bacteroidota bacterium]